MYKQYGKYQKALILTDMLLTGLMFLSIAALRPFLPGKEIGPMEVQHTLYVYFMVLPLWHILFIRSGVYEVSKLLFFKKQVGPFTSAYLLAVFVFSGVLYFTFRDISRLQIIYFSIVNYAVLLLTRYLFSLFLKKSQAVQDRTKVLIVGLTNTGIRLAGTMQANHSRIYELVGFAGDETNTGMAPTVPVIGKMDEVPDLCVAHNVGLVLIAPEAKNYDKVENLVRSLASLPVRVYLAPDVLELPCFCSEIDNFDDIPVIGIREPIIHGPRRSVKRIIDLTVSSLLLFLTWPLWIVVTIAMKIDSRGPIFFKTERVGENGKLFMMLKFRSMLVGAEKLQDEVTVNRGEGQVIYKRKDDPRITRVGKWLRRTSLDELPQLINVLKGEMSLVGPRPEQPFIFKDYESSQCVRLAVPPGITGLWQVSGRSDLPLHLNTHYDLFYVRNYSLLLDLKILLRTIPVVIQGKGSY